jgi:glycosyltransferase involved in cell wall biosynthesis
MKIAFLDYVLEPDKPGRSGLSDIVWDMAVELVNQGHEVYIIASYHTDEFPDPRILILNFPTPPLGYRNLIGQLWILLRASNVIRRLNPDLVHTPEYVSTAVLAALNVKIPLILTVPGNIFHRIQHGHNYEWYYVQFLKWAAIISARKCAKVIAISQDMKIWWQRTGCLPTNTLFIPLGVNAERFHYVASARWKLGFRDDQQIYIFVGRFSYEKGITDLLLAVASLKKAIEYTDAMFYLIGDGPLMGKIDQQIRDLDLKEHVFLKQWLNQEHLSTWYSAADALLLPSYSEGFSRTIPEAMSCGTPVIGTKITGTEDHVLEGINGFLYEAHDVNGLARILECCVQNPHILRSMRSATQNYARKNFHWPKIMTRIVNEVYRPAVYSA